MNPKLTLISLTLIFLILTGCGKKQQSGFPAPSPQAFDGAFVSVSDSILIGSSKYAVDYGTLTVRENRRQPNSRFIHLPVKRIRSSSPAPLEPVFYFAGGPGRGNMEHIGNMWYLVPQHDVVLVGFRGVDGASVLDCPTVKKAMHGKGGLFTPKSMNRIQHAWSADAQRLIARGVDLDGYTMPEVVGDVELARQALGYERINLKSASYGTRVAQLYAYMHPESINRSVMVAVNPPGRFVWEPDVIDRQLHAYADLWARDSLAAMRSSDLYATITDVLDNMPSHWLFFPIDEGKVKCVAFCLFFQNTSAALVFNCFVAGDHGDYSGLAAMSLAYDFVLPGMFTWGDLASKAVSADYDPNRDYMTEMQPKDKPLGAPMSVLLWGPLKPGTWPIRSIPGEYKHPRYTDVSTLLVSGSIDAGTPTEFATNDLLPYLNNGRQIIIAECGHMDIESIQAKNFQRIVTSFYATGEPDTSLNTYQPMDFRVEWGFPRLMRFALVAIAFILILLTGLVMLITWAVRKLRQNQKKG